MSGKKRAYLFGLGAERFAALWLGFKGYRVIARRYRSPFGEIDLIALRCGTVCFVEVKARGTLGAAREAVTHRQKKRIADSAAFWLQQHRDPAYLDMRFDVVLIAPWRKPVHIINAFSTDD